MKLSVYVLILAGVFLAATGQVAFKIGADGRHALTEFINAWVALGLLCYGAGTVLWIFALSKAGLTSYIRLPRSRSCSSFWLESCSSASVCRTRNGEASP